MTNAGNASAIDERSEPREAILYRTRIVGPDGVERSATLVNVSHGGFMARYDGVHAVGARVALTLPRVGRVAADIRWSLGGRIGCCWHRPLGLADYHALLQALPRG